MKPIWAELTKGTISETEQIANLLAHTEANLFDPAVLSYGATRVFKAFDGEKNIVFMPVQQCQVWESLGINPEASDMEVAAGLKALATVLRYKAQLDGQGETYFLCKDERTRKFAEHHGFEEIKVPVFRMRLA